MGDVLVTLGVTFNKTRKEIMCRYRAARLLVSCRSYLYRAKYRDPRVVRSEDTAEDETIVKRIQTDSRMLSLFRQMEEQKESVPDGPKPLKCFTPPPDYKEGQSDSEEDEEESDEEEEESEDEGVIESLKEAQSVARARSLREKFEHWEPEKQSVNNAINLLESEQESIESTKSLRARFESMKTEQPKEKPAAKVNRFVEIPAIPWKFMLYIAGVLLCTEVLYASKNNKIK